MFDCVLPTRLGPHRLGADAGRAGEPAKRRASPATRRPLDEGCACPACARFSRAYIRHLVTQREIVGLRLLTLHNLHQLLDLVRGRAAAIVEGRFAASASHCWRDRLGS